MAGAPGLRDSGTRQEPSSDARIRGHIRPVPACSARACRLVSRAGELAFLALCASNVLMRRLLALVCWALLVGSHAYARVVTVEVSSRATVADGKSFGLAGPYERIAGTFRYAVDPDLPANRIITDIVLAPRNADGHVEFSAPFFILKPADMGRSNGTVLYEVSNRGRKGMLGFFNFGASTLDPKTAAHLGDGYLMDEGYTLLWLGWQFDPPLRSGLLRLDTPAATQDGKPIRGLVRSDFVVTDRTPTHSLADRSHVPYPVADPRAPENVLTVRDTADGKRQLIARERWRFARMENGEPVPDSGTVWLEGGFEANRIYEVVYLSENPPLVGLGPTAVRDAVSHLKYSGAEALGIPDDALDRGIAFGISQSGRFLRTFLYYGFNEDERGRIAFDGVMSHVAGGGRGSFNHRFAQPSRDAHPYMNFLHPTDIFPFTDRAQSDRETGREDGILTHALKREFWPKIFYTNSAYEYWGRAASLIHTTIDGKRDIELFDNVRVFLFSGTQHGPSSFPPRVSIGQQRANPLDFRWAMRALLQAMNRWAAEGSEPPASRYPRIADATLLHPEKLAFPEIPGVSTSTRVHRAYRVDYGPRFVTDGVITREPPEVGNPFPILVASVDSDGNEVPGVRMPEIEVPLATYTGWNLFNSRSGPTDEISSMVGSYIPFARTRAEREAKGDPRPSIEERYRGRDEFLGRVAGAGLDLVEDGLLLERDLPAIVRNASRHWDYLMEDSPGPDASR